MIPWMIYAALVGLLLGGAGQLLEPVLRSRGRPGRHVWAAALLLSLTLPALAPLRPSTGRVAAPAAEASGASGGWVLVESVRLPSLPRPALLTRAEPWVVPGWLAASGLLAVTLAGGLLRLGRRAKRWRRARLDEGEVLVSDGFGPAILGVLSPEVVLPPWTLALAPERLSMVWTHEDEHRRAGDARLLLAGALAVVAAPWNPALWWQLRRLRGAVEVDCDTRVLGRGVSAPAYGALLLELSTRIPGLPLPVAALSKPPSLLERRLTMIVRGAKRGGPVTTMATLGLAVGLFMLACEAPPPTAVEPAAPEEAAGMVRSTGAVEVSEPAIKVRQFVGQLGAEAGPALIYVDEVRVPEILRDLDPDDIASVSVVKGEAAAALIGPEAANGVIRIYTKTGGLAPVPVKEADDGVAAGVLTKLRSVGEREIRLKAQQARLVAEGDTTRMGGATFRLGQDSSRPELYVNGELFDGDLEDIAKEDIDRVEVVKGQEGRKDAIHVFLKKKSGGGDGVR